MADAQEFLRFLVGFYVINVTFVEFYNGIIERECKNNTYVYFSTLGFGGHGFKHLPLAT